MRTAMTILLAFTILAGCAAFAPRSTFSAPGVCGALAKQRLADAEMSGLATGYEKAIFDNTYQACLKVQAAR